MNKVDDIPLKETLPDSIRKDQTVQDICDAIKKEMQAVSRAAGYCLLLPRLDELSEALLDELAWEYHVDFYDQTMPIDQKREMVRQALENHRKKGTAAVVRNVVSIILEDGRVEEWFQYGGEPYHFRVILILGPMASEETIQKLVDTVYAVKNVRSWLDYVQFHRDLDGKLYFGGALGTHRKIEITRDASTELRFSQSIYMAGVSSWHRTAQGRDAQ